MDKDILLNNKNSWDKIAVDYFGVTALPEYGPFIKNEEELGLFQDIHGKCVLDIGCGSGHSLEYMSRNGAAELWGIDLSSNQIETARNHLERVGCKPKLQCAPMEEDIRLPKKQRWFQLLL